MIFYVPISVKPYVKRFIENNYGDPVDFRRFPREFEMFKRMLKKPCKRFEKHYKEKLSDRYAVIDVIITDNDFYRYGWQISNTDNVSFGKYFERNAKYVMRTFVGLYVSFGTPIDKAIEMFQEKFNIPEECWAFETIKKDFYRVRLNHDFNISQYAFENMTKIIGVNLTSAGVITKEYLEKV